MKHIKYTFIVLFCLLSIVGFSKLIPTTHEYKCSVLNGHGVYATMTVDAIDEYRATLTASHVTEGLIKRHLIPDNCIAMCELKSK